MHHTSTELSRLLLFNCLFPVREKQQQNQEDDAERKG